MTSFADKYTMLEKIGEGSFSQVLKVRDKQGQLYAAKKLLRSYQSMDEVWEVNEIKAIKNMDYHPNVIGIIDIIFEPETSTLYLISELFDMNLYEYIKDRKRALSELRVKNFLYQLVKGLHHLHRNDLFHRDIKPENILIRSDPHQRFNPSRADVIQLADLGSATKSSKMPPHSAYISTRWYRAPESLLTAGFYGPKIDIWALGCVFYELLTLTPLFPGDNELDQLCKIHEVLGVPSERVYRRFRHAQIPYAFQQRRRPTGLHTLVPSLSQNGYNILERTLYYAPDGRVNTMKLMEHAYFNDLRNHDKKIHRAFSSSPSLLHHSYTSCSSSAGSTASNRTGSQVQQRRKSQMRNPALSMTTSIQKTGTTTTGGRSLLKCSVSSAVSSISSMGASGSGSAGVSSAIKAGQKSNEMKVRERLWGMNPGSAKKQYWQRLQKNITTVGARKKPLEGQICILQTAATVANDSNNNISNNNSEGAS